ncbi:amine oxidase catalytic domain-containing protein [Tothia fuscella]|uniref:Amine oxidase n=1 Tax=Tothia fuscella TaxID=1048955 RepID=A0A9P4TVT2_9PEZI|nr:amine oxidase catalytic domain-containing protein [Tothia fuscella]
MHSSHSPIETEASLDWPHNSGAMYVVLNDDSVKVWGEQRGYGITPGTCMGSPPHLTMKNSTALGNAANWIHQDLWVVKQKDWERRSAFMYFNLGTHHISTPRDIPNALMNTASSSVMLVPHNFHDRDPSRASVQSVRLDMRPFEEGGGSNVKYYEAKYKKGFEMELTI